MKRKENIDNLIKTKAGIDISLKDVSNLRNQIKMMEKINLNNYRSGNFNSNKSLVTTNSLDK